MKKTIIPVIAALMVLSVLAVGLVSAQEQGSYTSVSGTVYNSTAGDTVSGATIYLSCGGQNVNTTTSAIGTYDVEFDPGTCDTGVTVTAYATKGNLTSPTQSTTIENSTPGSDFPIYFGVINITMVPEFGIFTGMVALLGAAGIFFFVRRK